MKTAKEFLASLPSYHPAKDWECIAMLEARDQEIKAAAFREAATYFRTTPLVRRTAVEQLELIANRVERGG